jgi:uncharacterized protein (TIGR02271 family)
VADMQSTSPGASEVSSWRGRTMSGSDGEKIGTIDEIYLDAETGRPEWALTSTGLLGTKSKFVPLIGASTAGEEVRVQYNKDQVNDAPGVDPDGELSQEEESALDRHYGLEYSESRSGSGLPEGGGGGRFARGGGDAMTRSEEADAMTRSEEDDAMTRSEEELRVGTAEQERGRARLRKWVETEQVDETVPVKRETARVEREPITEQNVDDAMGGPEISESEHEVTLHEEEPVVEKRTVPKERVRLEKDTETDEEHVSETVRKERIESEGDAR